MYLRAWSHATAFQELEQVSISLIDSADDVALSCLRVSKQ